MNIKSISAALVVILLLFGCTDMLEQTDPTGPTGETFLANSEELQLAVVGAYSGLSRSQVSFHWRGIEGFEQFSDNVYNGSANTDGPNADWTNFNYDPANLTIENGYTGLYQLISSCNLVFDRAPFADVPEAELRQALGEVSFLRGYAYFFLTSIWGEVPIVTEVPEDPSGFAPAPATATEVYEQAVSDLQFAERNLSEDAAQGGRATSWAAKAMLAQVYLFGADELNRPEWYTLATNKAFEVINNGPYGLFNDLPTPKENLESIFQSFNDNGKEHIFSIGHFNSGGAFSDGQVGTQVPMAMNPRQERNNNNLWGFGWAYVYEALDVLWDDADARKDYNIWLAQEPVIVNGVMTSNYNQSRQNRCCARSNGFGFQKFWYQENTKNVNGISTLDYPVLRYAELLLIAAEADLLDDGNISAPGVMALNMVRNRAGLPSLLQGEITIMTILQERRWELFGEAKRWFDFVRKRNSMPSFITQSFAAITANDSDGDDNDFSSFSPDRHFKLPYPQAAVDRNPNLNQKAAWAGN